MLKITVIGAGNVAHHLIRQIERHSDLSLVEVYARTPERIRKLFPSVVFTNNIEGLKEADLYVIAVSDDAIATISAQLPFLNRLVVHTSGTQSLSVLSDKNKRAVWYPLQTFSKEKEIDFKEMPICIEATNEEDYKTVERFTQLLFCKSYRMTSGQRKALHVAAVFSSNFVNHLYALGEQVCIENQIPFEVLQPLIQETANKINTLSPTAAQTGPASRKDSTTTESHTEFLKEDPRLQNLYKLLTASIQESHVEKL